MNADRPEFLISGEPARLIPVVADGSREKRIASVVLAVMTAVPAFARALIAGTGKSIGKSARVECWTEVVFTGQENAGKDRPDGLIVVSTGRSRWSALVEAKIGNQELVAEQVGRYAELARANGIEAEPVLPYSWTLTKTFASGVPRALATAEMIRRLAWWGITRSRSATARSRWFPRTSTRASGTTP